MRRRANPRRIRGADTPKSARIKFAALGKILAPKRISALASNSRATLISFAYRLTARYSRSVASAATIAAVFTENGSRVRARKDVTSGHANMHPNRNPARPAPLENVLTTIRLG